MKSFFATICVVILLCGSEVVHAQARSPSPHGTRQDVIAVAREAGILGRGVRVHDISHFGDRWLLAIRLRDGTFHNYSVDTRMREVGYICKH